MSRLTTSLLWRLPLAATKARANTTRFFSQSRITCANTSDDSKKSGTTTKSSPDILPLEPIDTYTSIIAHSSSPSTLTTELDKIDQTKLGNAAKFFQKDAKFLYSASKFPDHPFNEHIPEVVILGASNVGKSTFLNALVGKPGIARTSPKPGHTTLMNAFGVGPPPQIPRQTVQKGTPVPRHSLIVMDTPGYGYRSQSTWGDTIVRYLGARKTLKGAVVLLSAEKRLMGEDRWLLEALADANVRTMVVVTKADKMLKGGGAEWAAKCAKKAVDVRRELQRIQRGTGRDWREDAGWSSDVFVTAAKVGKASSKAGMGGVRAAILEMAGFKLEDAVEQQPENISYTGKIVSFDDIVWKS
ncbi:hypothetical protein PWT90_04409 [Aphanocladium album]|nr:hypothetical protein PWT90_04409 [Aphanocladium album]